jgi:HlyD family secretion protein
MYVYAKTDEGDVGQIRPGHTADFQVDAFPKEVFHGVVSQVRMNATTVQNVVTYDTIVEFHNPDMKLFPGMTAYVSIPVASVNDVVKVPNAALRYKPDLPVEQVQGLYSKYGIAASQTRQPSRAAAAPSQEPGGGTREHAAPSTNGTSDTAVVWKLLPDKSLQPIQIRIGLTDHTFTALTSGDVKPGEELVTGATTAKAAAAPSMGGQRR